MLKLISLYHKDYFCDAPVVMEAPQFTGNR